MDIGKGDDKCILLYSDCKAHSYSHPHLSAVGELGVFVRMLLLNLYLNEVERLGPGPCRRGGAVVAPGHRGQGPDPNTG
jgi:hypothetical protein